MVIGVGLIAQMTFWFPDWLAVFLLVQVVACWELMSEMGVVEMVQTQVQAAEGSLNKFIDMIPRHKSE